MSDYQKYKSFLQRFAPAPFKSSGELPPIEEGIAPLPLPYNGPQVSVDNSPLVPQPPNDLNNVWESIKAGSNKLDSVVWPPIEQVMPPDHFKKEAALRQIAPGSMQDQMGATPVEPSWLDKIKAYSDQLDKKFWPPIEEVMPKGHFEAEAKRRKEGEQAEASPSLLGRFLSQPVLPQPHPEIASGSLRDYLPKGEPVETPAGKLSQRLTASSSSSGPAAPNLSDLDVGTGTINTMDNLHRAQQTRDNVQLANQVMKGLELAGAGVAGAKPIMQDAYDQNIKNAEGIVTDFKARGAQEENDPKSPSSKAFREFAKRFGVNLKGDFSAAMGEKLIPLIFKEFQMKEERSKDERIAKENRLARADGKKAQDTYRDDQFISQSYGDLVKSKPYVYLTKTEGSLSRINSALLDPNGVKDIGALYEFIKGLDPDSAVREGEVQLGQRALGLWGSIGTMIKSAGTNPRVLNTKMLQDVQQYLQEVQKDANNQYDLLRNSRFEQAKSRGVEEARFGEIDPIILRERSAAKKKDPKVDSKADSLFGK